MISLRQTGRSRLASVWPLEGAKPTGGEDLLLNMVKLCIREGLIERSAGE